MRRSILFIIFFVSVHLYSVKISAQNIKTIGVCNEFLTRHHNKVNFFIIVEKDTIKGSNTNIIEREIRNWDIEKQKYTNKKWIRYEFDFNDQINFEKLKEFEIIIQIKRREYSIIVSSNEIRIFFTDCNRTEFCVIERMMWSRFRKIKHFHLTCYHTGSSGVIKRRR
jgi:hypothetical protein